MTHLERFQSFFPQLIKHEVECLLFSLYTFPKAYVSTQMGLAFKFNVVLIEETQLIPENIQIFVNGKEIETFEVNFDDKLFIICLILISLHLERLMAVSPKIAVCRTSSEMTINVSNPIKMSAPNTILNLFVNLDSNTQNDPSVFNTPIDYTTLLTK